MNDQTQMPFMATDNASALTPAERIQKLIELTHSLQALERKSTVADEAFQEASRNGYPDAHNLGLESDAAVGRETTKGDEIIEHVKELLGDGVLGKFDRLLRNEALEAEIKALRRVRQKANTSETGNRWMPATERAHSRFRYPSLLAGSRTGFFDLNGAVEMVKRMKAARGVDIPPPQFPTPGHKPPARKSRMADRFFDLFCGRSQDRQS